MSTPKHEAWLDVAAFGVPELANQMFDVTVRHPRAQRYRPASEQKDGAALVRAAADKQGTYPAACGRCVVALGHETWGRLSEEAEHILQLCAAVAARRDYRRGRLPGDRVRRWRAMLDASLQRAVAEQRQAAAFGLPGRPVRRRRAIDLTNLEVSGAWPAGAPRLSTAVR